MGVPFHTWGCTMGGVYCADDPLCLNQTHYQGWLLYHTLFVFVQCSKLSYFLLLQLFLLLHCCLVQPLPVLCCLVAPSIPAASFWPAFVSHSCCRHSVGTPLLLWSPQHASTHLLYVKEIIVLAVFKHMITYNIFFTTINNIFLRLASFPKIYHMISLVLESLIRALSTSW